MVISKQQASAITTLEWGLRPMLARLGRGPFDSPDYLFELHWNGIRALAHINDGGLTLQDRNGHDLTEIFPELSSLPSHVGSSKAILDGEIVCLDSSGHPSFTLLEQRLAHPAHKVSRRRHAHYVAYDLLYVANRSVMDESLVTRKNLLHSLLQPSKYVQAADYIDSQGKAFFQAICQHDLEGIVAKRKSSSYISGKRSNEWLNIKRIRQGEFVIGGYTFDGNKRDPLRSLILGLYKDDQLHYVGQVSSGIGPHSKRLTPILEQQHWDRSPFVQTPTIRRFSYWCRPESVCQVEYGEFSEDGNLAYPIFKGIRGDVSPEDCLAAEIPGWPRQLRGLH